jgi:hypothetical protein
LRSYAEKAANRLMVATFWASSVLLFVYNIQIRTFTRWFLWSGRYKNKVLAQPASVNGALKHIEDFSVFLVFDPADSLSAPAKSRQSGKLNGIPCEVSSVRLDGLTGISFISTSTLIHLRGTAANKTSLTFRRIRGPRS